MPQTTSSLTSDPLTEAPTSDEMTTNNAHSSLPPITSAFSTDHGTISDTTSKIRHHQPHPPLALLRIKIPIQL